MKTFLYLLIALVFLLSNCSKKEDLETGNTNQAGTVIDIDGNTYKIVTIGTQVWMAENLKTTKYNDGTVIPYVVPGKSWEKITSPAYCWFKDDIKNQPIYGGYYNWYVVNTGKLAPKGWHVPTKADFETLVKYLGGETLAGGKLKSNNATYWTQPNTGATNSTGFNGIGGGLISVYGYSGEFGTSNYLLTSTILSVDYVSCLTLYADYSTATLESCGKMIGANVRCIKD